MHLLLPKRPLEVFYLTPYTDVCYKFSKRQRLRNQRTSLRILWDQASHIGLVHRGVAAFSNWGLLSAEEREATISDPTFSVGHVYPLLEEVGIHSGEVSAIYAAFKWPGTLTNIPSVLVIANKKDETLRKSNKGLHFQTENGWEDLILFRGERVMYYVCSHERFGTVFGDDSTFTALTVSPEKCDESSELSIMGRGISL